MSSVTSPNSTAPTLGNHRSQEAAPTFVARLLWTAGVVAALAVAASMLFFAADVFLMVFAATLGAVVLRGMANALKRQTGLPEVASLALTILALLVLSAGILAMLGSAVAGELGGLSANLNRSTEQARAWLADREWGRSLIELLPAQDNLFSAGSFFTRVSGVFSASFGIAGNLILVLAVSIYLAADPQRYLDGLLLLFPIARRPRIRQVLDEVGNRLLWWMVSRLIAMVAVALLSSIGLWLLGIPQYLSLAILAGLLTVVPTFGPIVSAVPAILVGLLQGPLVGVAVIPLYMGIQAVENYLLTPLVQQKTVDLPPALALPGMVLAGALFGGPGLILGTPLTLALMILVRRLYVEDTLGDDLGKPAA